MLQVKLLKELKVRLNILMINLMNQDKVNIINIIYIYEKIFKTIILGLRRVFYGPEKFYKVYDDNDAEV
jgi:hypothetical protein